MLFEVVITAIYIWILHYLIQLEKSKCECALGLKHRIIKTYLTIMIPLSVFMIALQIMHTSSVPNAIKQHPKKTVMIYVILLMIKIAFIGTVFMYIRELKETKCDCSVNHARNALEILNYLSIVITTLLVFGGVLIGSNSFSRIVTKELYMRFK